MPGRKINPHRGWEIYEKGLYDILMDLKKTTAICLVIFRKTAWALRAKRRLSAPMGGEDDYRIDFIREHLKWLHRALAEGSQCKALSSLDLYRLLVPAERLQESLWAGAAGSGGSAQHHQEKRLLVCRGGQTQRI